jgi:D-arginine dehydrogenase
VTGNDFDVVVIGAGIAGSSVAARLAETLRVAVLERESQPGYHSTGRSAALFSEIYGAEPVRALSRASRSFLFAPPSGFSETSLVKPRGALYIATAEQRAGLAAFTAAADVALHTRALTGRQACNLCPILRVEQIDGALVAPNAADVDVHALHQGYLRLLRQRGGVLLTNCAVQGLRRDGGAWTLATSDAVWRAPVVVNAAGAWADTIAAMAGVAPIGLQPMRRTALLVDPPEDESIGRWPFVIDIGEKFYFKPDAGSLLLSPADETPSEPCDAQPDEWDVALAVDRVESITTLKVARVKHKWAGLRSFVSDRVPVVGPDPDAPGFFWLAAQGGYGIQTCPAIADAAAALLQGRPLPEDLTAAGVDARDLAPGRFRAAPEMYPSADN